eukprot:2646825-Pyramimonas_sp.AAC.1
MGAQVWGGKAGRAAFPRDAQQKMGGDRSPPNSARGPVLERALTRTPSRVQPRRRPPPVP